MSYIRLVHWNKAESAERGAVLEAAGYTVDSEPPQGPLFLQALRNRPPDAVVIDLSRLPSHGRDIGLMLRKTAATRAIPIIFADGDREKVRQIKTLLPDAVYANWGTIRSAVRKALSYPPKQPVVPQSIFAAYANVPLPKKLGIKPNTLVALVNAPRGIRKKLTPLPENVTLVQRVTRSTELTIWFNTSEKEMSEGLGRIAKRVGAGRLWIVWLKKKGTTTNDLTQTIVRARGLAAGLVDYKICSLDESWSGLLFTRRKPNKKGKHVV